ncbi:hypothetical protein LCGC14_3080720, partial [marine sediment metagenome]
NRLNVVCFSHVIPQKIVNLRGVRDAIKMNHTLRINEISLPKKDVWGSDKDCPVEDWIEDVTNNATRLGYWDWVEHMKKAN